MEETKELLRQLHSDHKQLIETELPQLRNSQTRTRRVVIVLIVAVLVAAVCVWRLVDYALCNADRTRALTGPGNDRVTYLLNAFQIAAAGQAPLTKTKKAADLAELDSKRDRYSQIPPLRKLAAGPDSQIVIWIDATAALDAQAAYNMALKHHPVCSVWGI